MANESAKKILARNKQTLERHRNAILAANAAYLPYRLYVHHKSLTNYHLAALLAFWIATAALYGSLRSSAAPKYAPGGALAYAGADLHAQGVIEYCFDLLYTVLFIQLATGFLSDWFALLALVPPCIGIYYAWVKIIYPWISKPDAPSQQELMQQQMATKGRRGRR